MVKTFEIELHLVIRSEIHNFGEISGNMYVCICGIRVFHEAI